MLDVVKAVEIVDVALDVQRGLLVETGANAAATSGAVAALEAISQSLAHDLPRS